MDRIVIVGPGRAGMAVGLAARNAGHHVVALVSRRPIAGDLAPNIMLGSPIPEAEFVFVAVRDDAIGEVVARINPTGTPIVAHLSGRTSVDVLAPLGSRVGSFHPLMTLPSGEVGAAALAGAGAAITSHSPDVVDRLSAFATSLGMRPFLLPDEAKDSYHAAATAASNYVVVSLAVAERLFEAAGVAPDAAGPLIGASIANVEQMGARAALTGPIARGDIETVLAQRAAARSAGVEEAFVALGTATAFVAGTWETMREALS